MSWTARGDARELGAEARADVLRRTTQSSIFHFFFSTNAAQKNAWNLTQRSDSGP